MHAKSGFVVRNVVEGDYDCDALEDDKTALLGFEFKLLTFD
jgi:hypothetical protein